MLNLAVKNRVDSGVIGQIVAKLIFREQKLKFQKHLKLISPGFDEVEFGIIFYSKKWAPFVKKLNSALAKFKTTDQFETTFNKYPLNPSISAILKVGRNCVFNLNTHNPTPPSKTGL